MISSLTSDFLGGHILVVWVAIGFLVLGSFVLEHDVGPVGSVGPRGPRGSTLVSGRNVVMMTGYEDRERPWARTSSRDKAEGRRSILPLHHRRLQRRLQHEAPHVALTTMAEVCLTDIPCVDVDLTCPQDHYDPVSEEHVSLSCRNVTDPPSETWKLVCCFDRMEFLCNGTLYEQYNCTANLTSISGGLATCCCENAASCTLGKASDEGSVFPSLPFTPSPLQSGSEHGFICPELLEDETMYSCTQCDACFALEGCEGCRSCCRGLSGAPHPENCLGPDRINNTSILEVTHTLTCVGGTLYQAQEDCTIEMMCAPPTPTPTPCVILENCRNVTVRLNETECHNVTSCRTNLTCPEHMNICPATEASCQDCISPFIVDRAYDETPFITTEAEQCRPCGEEDIDCKACATVTFNCTLCADDAERAHAMDPAVEVESYVALCEKCCRLEEMCCHASPCCNAICTSDVCLDEITCNSVYPCAECDVTLSRMTDFDPCRNIGPFVPCQVPCPPPFSETLCDNPIFANISNCIDSCTASAICLPWPGREVIFGSLLCSEAICETNSSYSVQNTTTGVTTTYPYSNCSVDCCFGENQICDTTELCIPILHIQEICDSRPCDERTPLMHPRTNREIVRSTLFAAFVPFDPSSSASSSLKIAPIFLCVLALSVTLFLIVGSWRS